MDNKKVYFSALFHNENKIRKYLDVLKELKEKLKQNERNHEILKSFDSTMDEKIRINFFFFSKF